MIFDSIKVTRECVGKIDMITRDEYLNHFKKEGLDQVQYDQLVEGLEEYNFEETAHIALKVYSSMPGMGILSVNKRFNCFMAVCRHIDTFVEDGQIDETQGQMVLNIIRIKNPKFAKAISAFVSMVQRMSIREQADLPKTASIVLNFMTRSRFVDDHGNPA